MSNVPQSPDQEARITAFQADLAKLEQKYGFRVGAQGQLEREQLTRNGQPREETWIEVQLVMVPIEGWTDPSLPSSSELVSASDKDVASS